jgi:methylated-DNA-[protein]-cysteine S-methyltransferase
MDTFTALVSSPVGPWAIEGTDDAVTAVYLPTQPRTASRGHVPRAVARAASQLEEYFGGSRTSFDVPLAHVASTEFQRDVWKALSEIPFGEVRTYGEIAEQAGRPRASRAVGNANHVNPFPVFVPCHRVVASHGLGGYGGGEHVKRYLLDLEGVHY